EGKRQQYKLGQYFRRRYNKLLGDKYSPNKVYIQSADRDRLLMSAQANLAGLFPPHAEEKWNEDIAWQPIPVHTMPLNLDYALRGVKFPIDCPRYSAALEKYRNESPEVQNMFKENNERILYWISDWARKAIEPNGVLEAMALFKFKMYSNTKEMARLWSGFLIKEMFERFAQKLNSTLVPNRSVWFYSTQDITIGTLLNSFELFETHALPFASSLHLELYKNGENEHYIQIFFRKSNEEILLPLNIPNCGEKCTLDQLYNLYNDIIPDRDHDTECRLTN
ncbi:testicular acid phosphatase homolog, partial [Contarinia nasturtii]|uniref:testicular acid phosphatase homolog n=1 Tax=Contarinia nasturtii TaxID=265458 RepID=UPI0012D3BCD1